MRIEKISDNKIRVTVNKEDIKIWNVSMKNLTDNTPEAQDMFWFALRQAEKDVDFKVGKSQLLVEAVPSNAEGFIMLISKIEPGADVMDVLTKNGKIRRQNMDIKIKNRSRTAPIVNIFRFEDFEHICQCVCQTKDLFCGSSALYKFRDSFYLVMIPLDTMAFFEAENIILEYASRVQNPTVMEGILKEHGTEMIREGAVEAILTHFAE